MPNFLCHAHAKPNSHAKFAIVRPRAALDANVKYRNLQNRLKFAKGSPLARDLESTFPKTIVTSTGHLVVHTANQGSSDEVLCRLLMEVRSELLHHGR